MSHPVVHFEVAGQDGEALKAFYEGVFGWKTQHAGGDYWLVEKEGEGIGGGISKSQTDSGHVTFYVQADDVQAVLDEVESLGGSTKMPVTDVPGMVRFASFTDPQGNVVGVVWSQTPE
jgi:uncharacterized protein